MKYVYFIFFVLFIGITLGIVDIDVKLSDGSHFHYDSWIHLFMR
nr:MAG TPA: hypothetical protein [Caudoviricetes sp.]